MANFSHSIGKMETWEPEDKSFSKHTLREGTGDLQPNEGAVCSIHITPVGELGTTESDLGCYKLNETTEVTIGESDSVFGQLLDAIFCSMKEGEHAYIKSKIDLQGKKILEADLKQEALKFSVTLITFNRAAESSDLEQDERLERGQQHKEKGTALYIAGNVKFAVQRFERALKYLHDMEPVQELPGDLNQRYWTLKCQCYSNLAAACLKGEDYDKVVDYCTSALQIEPKNTKGLFRRGQAYAKLNKYVEALADFKAAKVVDPNNKAVLSQIQSVEAMMKKEKQMYQKMFT